MQKIYCDSYCDLLNTISSYGDALDKALTIANKTRDQLCEFLQIDKSSLSKIISNQRPLDVAKIKVICNFLKNNLLRDYAIYDLSKD